MGRGEKDLGKARKVNNGEEELEGVGARKTDSLNTT